jgi:hypothetical protein
MGFKLATLVVMGTDCTGSCKSEYHTITTTTDTELKEMFTNTVNRAIDDFELTMNPKNIGDLILAKHAIEGFEVIVYKILEKIDTNRSPEKEINNKSSILGIILTMSGNKFKLN